MTLKQLKIQAERQLLEDLETISWFDGIDISDGNGIAIGNGISIGIDWMTNTIVVADIDHPDGATIEIGTFSDLRAI